MWGKLPLKIADRQAHSTLHCELVSRSFFPTIKTNRKYTSIQPWGTQDTHMVKIGTHNAPQHIVPLTLNLNLQMWTSFILTEDHLTAVGLLQHAVEQGFSKWVMGHPGVPWRQSRGDVTYFDIWNLYGHIKKFKNHLNLKYSCFQSVPTKMGIISRIILNVIVYNMP